MTTTPTLKVSIDLAVDPANMPPIDDLLALASIGFERETYGDSEDKGHCVLFRLCPQRPEGGRMEELKYVPYDPDVIDEDDEGAERGYWRVRIFHDDDETQPTMVVDTTASTVLEALLLINRIPYSVAVPKRRLPY